jgi:hypothetical protein
MVLNRAPVLAAIPGKVVDEGSLLSFTVIASDPDGDELTSSLDSAPAGASIDPATGLFTWTPPDGPSTVDVTVRVTDDADLPLFDTETFAITVNNVAPILTISGEEKAYTGVPYELSLSSSDPGDDAITSWTIDWGDGTVTPVAGNPPTAEHTYTAPLPFPSDFDGDGDVDGLDALRFVLKYRRGEADDSDLAAFASDFGKIDSWDAYLVTATATDEDGTYTSNTLPVVDPPPPVFDHTEATPVHTEVPVLDSGEPANGGSKYEHLARPSIPQGERSGSGFTMDSAFGRAVGEWQARTSALRDFVQEERWEGKTEFKPFEYKPWSSTPKGSLVDLEGEYEDEDLIGERRVKEAGGESRAPWVEKFVSDLGGLEDSIGSNSDIRIVLSEEDEVADM